MTINLQYYIRYAITGKRFFETGEKYYFEDIGYVIQ